MATMMRNGTKEFAIGQKMTDEIAKSSGLQKAMKHEEENRFLTKAYFVKKGNYQCYYICERETIIAIFSEWELMAAMYWYLVKREKNLL